MLYETKGIIMDKVVRVEMLLREFITTAGYDIKEKWVHAAGEYEGHDEFTGFEITKRARKTQTPTNAYTEDFNCLWKIYPKRVGSNSKVDAYRAYNARTNRDHSHQVIMDGVVRYKAFCEANNSINTKYVLQASTFMGKSQHYLNKWEVTKEMTMIKLPANNDDLPAFAVKHKLRQPSAGETYTGYRKSLQNELDQLNKG